MWYGCKICGVVMLRKVYFVHPCNISSDIQWFQQIPTFSSIQEYSSYIHHSTYVLQVDLINTNLVILTTYCLFTLHILSYASLWIFSKHRYILCRLWCFICISPSHIWHVPSLPIRSILLQGKQPTWQVSQGPYIMLYLYS